MPDDSELASLREEAEDLAGFLSALQREYHRLLADFAAVLHAAGGEIGVDAADFPPLPPTPRIERHAQPETGAIIFRLTEDR